MIREPSPRNEGQKKSRVWIKRKTVGEEIHVLCRSDGRKEKDHAIRDKHEQRLLADLAKLRTRVTRGRLRAEPKVQQALGRLRERYPRVARYHDIAFDAAAPTVTWSVRSDRMEKAQRLDGACLLKTDRTDLGDEDVWRTYVLLTRVESAFRSMRSPLAERPIFHHLQRRVQTHIFLCVLAYHLLVAIEQAFLDAGLHTSWATLRDQLSTHHVCTIVLPTSTGAILKIRKGGTPDQVHREIYRVVAGDVCPGYDRRPPRPGRGLADRRLGGAGERGAVVHWDGSSWTRVESGTSQDLHAVASAGPHDVWVVGRKSTILHLVR